MTLAPNLPLRLNGNRMLSCLVFFICLTACSTVQPVPTTQTSEPIGDEITKVQVYNPTTGQYEEVGLVKEKVDTIDFEIVHPSIATPITDETPVLESSNDFFEEKKNSYDVAMLLPFVSNSAPSPGMQINRKSLIAIQFYAGAQIALEQLEDEGVGINLSVFDTKANASEVSSLLNKEEIVNSDLIIGPYRNSCVDRVAKFAKMNETPVVSPFTPHEKITRDNPYFIQMNPSLRSHIKTILSDIKSKYEDDQITVVSLDNASERERLEIFQSVHKALEGNEEVEPLNEFIITREIAEEEDLPIDTTLFVEGRKAVYIFPSWSSERQIYEFLRKINLAKGSENELVVYGMPQWMDLDYYDYFERLNVHVTSSIYLDREDRRVQKFKTDYYNQFGDLPDQYAYLGYDTMLYFGRQLAKNGVQFHKILDQEDDPMMSAYFDFERIRHDVPQDDSDMDTFDQYENGYLNLLQFKNYRFQRVE